MKQRKHEKPIASDANHDAYKRGCVLFDRGDFSKAVLAYKEALEYWPDDPEAWWALGNCYDSMNKPNKAESCFRRALDFAKPEDKENILFNLGNALFDQGRYQDAVSAYEQLALGTSLREKAN